MHALGGPECRVGSQRAWQGVGWDGVVGPLIRAAGAFEASRCAANVDAPVSKQAKSGSSRVESRTARERRGVVWVCLACRAQGQGQGRVGGWVRFEVSFPVSQSVNRCDLVLVQTAVCDLQVWYGVVQETVRGSCRQMREVETSTQTKRGRTFLQVASPVLSVP